MKRLYPLILTLLLLAQGALAQETNTQKRNAAFRDSLSAAAEELSFHPDSVNLILKKASWNVELEQWEYAKDEYDKALRIDPNNLAALYFRAYVNEKLLRYNFARLDYEKVLWLNPGNYHAQLGLALLNQKDKHKTEALDQINNVVMNFPDSATAWAARANMEVENQTYEVADYDYTEALKRAPGNKDYLLAQADVRIQLGDMNGARKNLNELVRLGTPRMSLKTWYDKTRMKGRPGRRRLEIKR